MEEKMFYEIFKGYIKHHESSANVFEKRSPITIRGYYNKLFLVMEFLGYNDQSRIRGSEFKTAIAKKYFEYLLKNNRSHNYAARCVDICSTVLDYGVNNDMAEYNPLSSFVVPKMPPKKPTYFTPLQICKWENYRSAFSQKQIAADLFVLIMHTGFDYGDLSEIGRHNLTVYRGQRYLVKNRHKNGNEAIIPLTKKAEEILDTHGWQMSLLSNPQLNQLIKEIAADLEMNIYLTVKSGRKIYMMNKLNNEGYSIEATSKMGGHKSIKTTEQTYAQVNIHLVHNEITERKKII